MNILFPQTQRRYHPCRQHGDGNEAHWNQHFPAQAHDLVVTVAWEGGANPQIAVQHERHFGEHPNRARRADNAPALRERRKPAAKEHDGSERAD